jgi:hypothetical protein
MSRSHKNINKLKSLMYHRLRMLLKCKGRIKYDKVGFALVHKETTKTLEIATRLGWII